MKWVVAAQTEEEEDLLELRAYYEGTRGMDITVKQEEQLLAMFTPETVETIRTKGFVNLSQRAVRVILERLALKQVIPAGDPSTTDGAGASANPNGFAEQARIWWRAAQLEGKQQDLTEYVMRDKAGVLIVGWDDEANIPTFDVNELWDGESGQCRLHFDSDTSVLLFVSKRWAEIDEDTGKETGTVYRTLYFPNRIERFVSDDGAPGGWRARTLAELAEEGIAENPQWWTETGTPDGAPLGFAAVPFYNVRYIGEGADLRGLHDALNRSVLDMILTGNYHGFPMIAFEGNVKFQTDPDTGLEKTPKMGPGRAVVVPGGQVKRIESADMEAMFRGGPMSILTLTAYQKGWPLHVFTRIHPAADTIRASEGSLVKQCDAKKVQLNDSWRQALALANKLSRLHTGKFYAGEIDFEWEPSETQNELLDIQTKQTKADAAQLPYRWRLRLFGYSEDEIDQIIAERDTESEKRVRLSLADTTTDVTQ